MNHTDRSPQENARSHLPPGERVRVIACGMIAREIIAIKQRHSLERLDLVCLPAQFHFNPDRIVPAMEEAIGEARRDGITKILVGYADCGTGGLLDRLCEKHGIARIDGPHCFAFYQGVRRFEAIAEKDMTSFYMTDFLCRNFETFFIKPLGLDRHPELAREYFGNYRTLVYLAQTDDPALDRIAENAADLLDLTYERRPTGFGDLAAALVNAVKTT